MDGTGPYITIGELRTQTKISLDIKSESETMKMFNLDKLNEGHPEWLHRDAWDMGKIPKSTDSFIHSLVNRVDRERL